MEYNLKNAKILKTIAIVCCIFSTSIAITNSLHGNLFFTVFGYILACLNFNAYLKRKVDILIFTQNNE
jgi:hypothetical protein